MTQNARKWIVSLLVLACPVPADCAKACAENAARTPEHDVNVNLQVGLSVGARSHPPLVSRSGVDTHDDENEYLIDCGDSKTIVKDSRELCTDTSQFNDTLLVIHFNYEPRKHVVPFLLKRYSQCFSNIAVVAQEYPPDCPESKGISMLKCKHAHDYIHTQMCYAAALTANPGFRSYLIMNDDALFIPKRFMPYNRDYWWDLNCNPVGPLQQATMANPPTEHKAGEDTKWWECDHSSCGWDGVNGLVSWWNKKATEEMKKAYTAHMGGRAIIPATCWQDVVHIPQPMVPFYLRLAAEMPYLQTELFHAMVHLLWSATGGQEEHIPANELFWDLPWDHNNDPSHQRGSLDTLQMNPAAAMIHPLKLSNPTIWAKVDDWLFESSL